MSFWQITRVTRVTATVRDALMDKAVTEEGTHDVLGIFNVPQERATGWGDIFDGLKDSGLQRVGLIVADGIKGLDTVIGEKFPGTPLQRCVFQGRHSLVSGEAVPLTGTFPHPVME